MVLEVKVSTRCDPLSRPDITSLSIQRASLIKFPSTTLLEKVSIAKLLLTTPQDFQGTFLLNTRYTELLSIKPGPHTHSTRALLFPT
jgi:hypothetical protein